MNLEILDRVPLTRVEDRNLMATLSFQGDTFWTLGVGTTIFADVQMVYLLFCGQVSL